MWQGGDEPVPGYRLESFLGEGSNAKVWRAAAPGRTAAALKFINLGGRLGLKEFRGVQRVKEIRHAHLLPITAFWILDDQGGVMDDLALERLDDRAHGRHAEVSGTMEVEPCRPQTLVVAMLLGEKSLRERLDEHRNAGSEGIPVDELLGYMEDTARGIDFLNSPCHDLGNGPVAIQHCDIKPENIVLLGNSAMVCDFGLVRVLGGSRSYRTITGPAGTPAYIAPECVRGAVASCATDQYSLAITYAELRTGRLPFASESLMDVYEAHASGNLELGRLPDAERRVIRRATSLRPEDRYPSTLEMVRALEDAAGQQRGSTPPAPDALPPPDAAPPDDASAGPPPPATPQQANVYNQRAHAHFARGEYRLAIADFTEAIRINPRLAEAHRGRLLRNRAVAYRKLGDYPHALADYDQVIRLHPSCDRAYHDRAMVHQTMGDYDRAIDDYAEALRLAPEAAEGGYGRDYASAYRERGDARYQSGDCDQALADYNEAIRIQRDWGILYNQRGRTYGARGDYDEAIADYTEAIQLDAEYAYLYYYNRGSVYYKQGEYNTAIADFSAAIERKHDYRKAYRYRSRAYERIGMQARAEADLAQANGLP